MMKKEIREELEQMAPNLLEIGNHNPFKVPPMYFENLVICLDDVSDIPQQGIPHDYFQNLTDQVITKANNEKSARIFSLNIKRWVAAASIAILCVASYFTMNTNEMAIDNQSFVLDVELEEAFDYLTDRGDIYISEILELTEEEFFDENEVELFDGEDIDFLLDEVTLDDLDELL